MIDLTTTSTLRLASAMLLATALPMQALAETSADLPSAELVAAMQEGGHVIFIRHAQTERDYADQVDAVMGNCSTQRTLSEAGWADAIRIGAAFDRLEIPVGDVISSQYCRAWQTAALAFGRYEKTADLNFYPAEDYTDAQITTMREAVQPHLGRVPEAGQNTVLVGHDDPFEAATGIYPEPMGVTFVLRPNADGGFEILGQIPPGGWDAVGG